jgi:hypothetical protein
LTGLEPDPPQNGYEDETFECIKTRDHPDRVVKHGAEFDLCEENLDCGIETVHLRLLLPDL